MRKLGLLFAFLLLALPAAADSLVVSICGTLPLAYAPGATRNDTVDINGLKCINDTNAGTASVNIAQILGAAPSLTNPLWVFPATGATFPVSGTFFQATQPVSIAAAPLNAIGITPTDRTVTSATGASQTMMAANAARHSLTIVNTGNANCGVNPTGGTAVIGGAGTLTLSALGAYTPRISTLSAVTVICTSGQPIYGDEN